MSCVSWISDLHELEVVTKIIMSFSATIADTVWNPTQQIKFFLFQCMKHDFSQRKFGNENCVTRNMVNEDIYLKDSTLLIKS